MTTLAEITSDLMKMFSKPADQIDAMELVGYIYDKIKTAEFEVAKLEEEYEALMDDYEELEQSEDGKYYNSIINAKDIRIMELQDIIGEKDLVIDEKQDELDNLLDYLSDLRRGEHDEN
ncbi:MAG: hypothetical protein ABF633_03445 [Clostridium sp.]|uniref:hypothetical protein n=1 Tax=Clostridium sp. TaxID=1506 RepID=UPI0039ECEDDF